MPGSSPSWMQCQEMRSKCQEGIFDKIDERADQHLLALREVSAKVSALSESLAVVKSHSVETGNQIPVASRAMSWTSWAKLLILVAVGVAAAVVAAIEVTRQTPRSAAIEKEK